MMTSTYACPHGKKIAGQWVICKTCDNDEHGYYNYTKDRCDCYSGYNYRSSDTKCIACPANSSWNSSGEVCRCSANFYMQGDNANCQSCPEHSISSVGSTSVDNCACVANYYKNNNECVTCPEYSTSVAGSTSIENCRCNANYFKDNNQCQSCPDNSSSPVGSTSFGSCACNKGYYLSDSICVACPPGATTMNTGSTSISACVCPIGYVIDSDTNSCISDTTNYSATLDVYYDATNCSDPVAFMDSWTGCSSLDTIIANETVTDEELAAKTACLLDRRDYRTYRVRRFDDDGTAGQSSGDKCWMIDSMKFGGDYGQIDGCAANSGVGNFSNGGSSTAAKAKETFSSGYYGHCRYVGTANNTLYDHYLYDWVAAMQSTLAHNDYYTTFTLPHQGLCPQGWHVPSGGNGGEYAALGSRYGTYSSVSSFWTSSSKWNGQFSGYASYSSLYNLGSTGYYWSSKPQSISHAYTLYFQSSSCSASFYNYEDTGLALRCVKD